MPDHFHGLLEGRSEHSQLTELVRRFKQSTAFHYRRRTGDVLWQPGYHEHVLRSEEATGSIARYILENPIRAGLAIAVGEYPYCGSRIYSDDEVVELWREKPT